MNHLEIHDQCGKCENKSIMWSKIKKHMASLEFVNWKVNVESVGTNL